MNRTGRVGRDELEVDALAGICLAATVVLARLDDRPRELARARGVEPDVEEAGSGDLGGGDARRRGQSRGELGGELARRDAEALRVLHRRVRRPVAVLRVLRPLDRDVGRGDLDRGAASGRDGGQRGGDEGGEVVRIHDRQA